MWQSLFRKIATRSMKPNKFPLNSQNDFKILFLLCKQLRVQKWKFRFISNDSPSVLFLRNQKLQTSYSLPLWVGKGIASRCIRSVKNLVLLLCGFLRMNAPVFVYCARYVNLFHPSSRVLSLSLLRSHPPSSCLLASLHFCWKRFVCFLDLFNKY